MTDRPESQTRELNKKKNRNTFYQGGELLFGRGWKRAIIAHRRRREKKEERISKRWRKKEKSIRFRGARRRRVTGGHADLNALLLLLVYCTTNNRHLTITKTIKKRENKRLSWRCWDWDWLTDDGRTWMEDATATEAVSKCAVKPLSNVSLKIKWK